MNARRWNVAVAALALVHLVTGAVLDTGWFFSKYVDAAALLRHGALDGDAAADFSAGYFWFNTLASPQAIRWLQSLVGAAALFAVARLARRLAGRWSSLVAAAVFAVHPTVLAYEVTLEPDLFIAGLTVIALDALVRFSSRRAWLAALALGLLGITAALRPTSWLLFTLAGMFLVGRARRVGGWRAVTRGAALGVLVAIAPIWWRSHTIGGEVSATMSVGQVAYVGNRPESTGVGAVSPSLLKVMELQFASTQKPDFAHVLFRRFAQQAVGSGEPALAERYWLGLVAAFAREEPWGFIANLLRKTSWFLSGPSAHDITGVRVLEERVRTWAPIEPSLLAIACLVGLLFRARRRTARVLLVSVALWLLFSLIFQVTGRYSLPASVVLAPGLAVLVRRPRRLRLIAVLPLAVGALLVSNWWSHRQLFAPLLAAGAEGRAQLQVFLDARRRGDEAGARDAWVNAVGAQPFLRVTSDLVGFPPEARELAFAAGAARLQRLPAETAIDQLLLAQLAVEAGRCNDVEASLVELEDGPVWSIFDLPVAAWPLRVSCELARHNPQEAALAVDRALARRPGSLFALAHALAAERAVPSRPREALAKLLALHDPVSIDWAVTQAALAWGDLALADEYSARLVTRAYVMDAGIAWALRGQVLALRGDDQEAFAALHRACRFAPKQVFAVAPFEPMMARMLEKVPAPEVYSLAGELSFRSGRWAEAAERWHRAETLWGADVPAWHHVFTSRFARGP